MSQSSELTKPPVVFWIIAAFGLLWNIAGVAAFVHDVFFLDPQTLESLQRDFYLARPSWALAAYGTAVFGGALGCIALLLRRSWALPMLLVCLAGIIVQNYQGIFLGDAIQVFGPEGLILPFSVLGIAIFLAWWASYSKRKGWLS